MSSLPAIPLRPTGCREYDGHSSSTSPSLDPETYGKVNLSAHPRRAVKSHARKKPDDHIPRPRNAFIIFRSEFVKNGRVPLSIEAHHQNISRIAGTVWKSMSEDERRHWFMRAAEEKEHHAQLYPGYQFHPTDPYTMRNRRRVKKGRGEHELQIASRRCAEVAGLLVEGTEGEALEQAVLELDNRVSCGGLDISSSSRVTPNETDSCTEMEIRLNDSRVPEHSIMPSAIDGVGADVNRFDTILANRPGQASATFMSASSGTTNSPPQFSRAPISPTRLPSFAAGFGAAATAIPETSAYQYALPSKVRGYSGLPAFSSVFTSMQPRKDNDNDGGRWTLRAPARPSFAFRPRSESEVDSDYDCDSD